MIKPIRSTASYLGGWLERFKLLATVRNTLICSIVLCMVIFLGYYHKPYLLIWPGLSKYRIPAIQLYQGLLYLLVPLLTIPLLRSPNRLGLRLGNWRVWIVDIVIAYLVLVVLILIFGRGEAFARTYPQFKPAGRNFGTLLWYHLILLVYMFGWEFLFRGYMLFATEKELGKPAAVILQCLPFAILHAGKPELEAIGSIIAGLYLGLLALRANSMLPCAILHFAVACSMDIFAIFCRMSRAI